MTSLISAAFDSSDNLALRSRKRLTAFQNLNLQDYDPAGNHHELYAATVSCMHDVNPEVRKNAEEKIYEFIKNNIQMSLIPKDFRTIYADALNNNEHGKIIGYATLLQKIKHTSLEQKQHFAFINNEIPKYLSDPRKDRVAGALFGTAITLGTNIDQKLTTNVIANVWNSLSNQLPLPGYITTQVMNTATKIYKDDFKQQPKAVFHMAGITRYINNTLAYALDNKMIDESSSTKMSLVRMTESIQILSDINPDATRKGQELGEDRAQSFKLKYELYKQAKETDLSVKEFRLPFGHVYGLSAQKQDPKV